VNPLDPFEKVAHRLMKYTRLFYNPHIWHYVWNHPSGLGYVSVLYDWRSTEPPLPSVASSRRRHSFLVTVAFREGEVMAPKLSVVLNSIEELDKVVADAEALLEKWAAGIDGES